MTDEKKMEKPKYPFQLVIQKAEIKVDGEIQVLFGVNAEYFKKEAEALKKAQELLDAVKV